ncbi:hypothetical protein [Rubricoccus marinus]|uniref:Capsule polysaccharide biosynthesis protein n=1 Tax=Rubricoccus marinus TaxID=716817 RepID=A0A259U057_9BACT|nr:hypothetical protein [Rubricoccus marinus]OZC03415.1 hypothetical protein BSZ36_10735 [Rubricoccus marinus]
MRVLILAVAGYDERLAHKLAEEIRRQMPEARFAGITTREHNLASRTCYMRSVDLFESVTTQAQFLNQAAASGFDYDNAVLARLEADYGDPRLWPLVTADRRISVATSRDLVRYGKPFTRSETLSILQHRFLGLEAQFDAFQPDLLLFAGGDTSPGVGPVAERIAKARGIPVIVPHLARLGDLYVLADTVYSRFATVEETYRELLATPEAEAGPEALGLLREAGDHLAGRVPASPDEIAAPYVDQTLPPRGPLARAGLWRDAFVDGVTGRTRGDLQEIPPLNRLRDSFTRRLRIAALSARSPFRAPEASARYAFFPLHSEPEIALHLYAPYCVDQAAVVRNVAQSLPVGVALYVKEHPAMASAGWRSLSFYNELARTPNVYLVDGNAQELVAKSEAVITITGTPGWEAAIAGKPVLTLGEVFYNALSSHVTALRSPRDVAVEYERAIAAPRDHKSLELYVEAITRHGISVPSGALFNLASEHTIDLGTLSAYVSQVLDDLRRQKSVREN